MIAKLKHDVKQDLPPATQPIGSGAETFWLSMAVLVTTGNWIWPASHAPYEVGVQIYCSTNNAP